MAAKKTTTKAKATDKPAETKAEKFVRLAELRTTKAINAIRGIGKLSNRASYEFTDEQTARIAEALRDEVVQLHERFQVKEKQVQEGFKL